MEIFSESCGFFVVWMMLGFTAKQYAFGKRSLRVQRGEVIDLHSRYWLFLCIRQGRSLEPLLRALP